MACDEREMLDDWLRLRRVFLLRKCAGLTAGQLTTATPSNLSLLGLLRHMAEVENRRGSLTRTATDSTRDAASSTVATSRRREDGKGQV